MLHRIYTCLVATAFVIGLGTSAQAEETLLTVTFDGKTQTFDRAALEAFDLEVIETTTIWTNGAQTFEGVSLAAITDAIGAEEGKLLATAINDYTVEIPLSDAVENGPIIAMKLNGEEMSVRDKGPLWIVYPYDANTDYRTEVIYSRSIWQLDRIEVVQ